MEQDFYCHLCEEEGMEKYMAVAEQGCPKEEPVDVELQIKRELLQPELK